jgi:hypothetical protein
MLFEPGTRTDPITGLETGEMETATGLLDELVTQRSSKVRIHCERTLHC